MKTEKQFPALTDFEITRTMMDKGGGFVSRLGQLFRYADDTNKAILREAFAGYWDAYADATARCPECGRTEIINRHHDGQMGGVPECDFYQCEFCHHQWGHV